jgi:hypothetical protein
VSGAPPTPSPATSPTPAPKPTPASTATPRPSPTPIDYLVRAGDNLFSIARRFSTTARSIAFWNRATYPSLDPESPKYDPNRIEIGWRLVITPGAVFDEGAASAPPASPTARPSLSLPPAPTPQADGSGPLGSSIVLMHLGGWNTLQALPRLVDGLGRAGLVPITLATMLGL